jgi:hypothetical protein
MKKNALLLLLSLCTMTVLLPIIFLSTIACFAQAKNINTENALSKPQRKERKATVVYKNMDIYNISKPYLYHTPAECYSITPTIISQKLLANGEYEVSVKYTWALSDAIWRRSIRFLRRYSGIVKIETD